MPRTQTFARERPRLVGVAAKVLADRHEAEDIVQEAWLRLNSTPADIRDVPAWLTTVTVRLCLDRLRQRTSAAQPSALTVESGPRTVSANTPDEPDKEVELASDVGAALTVVLDRLNPKERVAFVLHDTFDVPFPTIADVLETNPAAARKMASRARSKVAADDASAPKPIAATFGGTDPRNPAVGGTAMADAAIIDAFMAAARHGDFATLLRMLAPEVIIRADQAAIAIGTPERIDGREEVAAFFNGAATAALSVFVADRPGVAWFDRGQAKVVFAFTLQDGQVQRIDFRAVPEVIASVQKRRATKSRDPQPPQPADVTPVRPGPS